MSKVLTILEVSRVIVEEAIGTDFIKANNFEMHSCNENWDRQKIHAWDIVL